MSTSISLCTMTPSLVKIDIVPSLAVLLTLISDDGKSWNVSACVAWADSALNGSCVTNFAWLTPPSAAPTRLVDFQMMGSPALRRSFLLM